MAAGRAKGRVSSAKRNGFDTPPPPPPHLQPRYPRPWHPSTPPLGGSPHETLPHHSPAADFGSEKGTPKYRSVFRALRACFLHFLRDRAYPDLLRNVRHTFSAKNRDIENFSSFRQTATVLGRGRRPFQLRGSYFFSIFHGGPRFL